jgi:cell wall-associated NlpC family hydrolase
MSIVKRVAAGVAVLALAFSALAGTELPARAEPAKPAELISVVKASSASADSKKTTKKKRKKSKGAKALAFAKKQLGDLYRYGGTGPNAWDCSGLTRGAWKAAGKKIPRTSQGQARIGKKVKKSKLKKGDLVFFYAGKSHVGIYAGNGKVIHASRPGKPVAYIKMKYMPYAGARRPA